MITAVYLAFAVASISMTIAKAGVFLDLRLWIYDRSVWLGELVMCPYCVSHWLAFGAVAVYQPRLVHSGFALLDLFVSAMIIVTLSGILFGILFWAFSQLSEDGGGDE